MVILRKYLSCNKHLLYVCSSGFGGLITSRPVHGWGKKKKKRAKLNCKSDFAAKHGYVVVSPGLPYLLFMCCTRTRTFSKGFLQASAAQKQQNFTVAAAVPISPKVWNICVL